MLRCDTVPTLVQRLEVNNQSLQDEVKLLQKQLTVTCCLRLKTVYAGSLPELLLSIELVSVAGLLRSL